MADECVKQGEMVRGKKTGTSRKVDPNSYCTVRVWVSRFWTLRNIMSPGHVALRIMPEAKTPEAGYVSFAPEEHGALHGRGKFYTYDDDLCHYIAPNADEFVKRFQTEEMMKGSKEGREKLLKLREEAEDLQKDGPRGCWTGVIYGLDIKAMLKWFQNHSGHQCYSMFNECATQVHHCLVAGGGDDYASWLGKNDQNVTAPAMGVVGGGVGGGLMLGAAYVASLLLPPLVPVVVAATPWVTAAATAVVTAASPKITSPSNLEAYARSIVEKTKLLELGSMGFVQHGAGS